jgi:endoglucanase
VSESRHLRRRVLRLARAILNRPTAPFHEDPVAETIRAQLAGIARIQTDRFGNMIARVGRTPKNAVAFCAHMDHPGFLVKKVRGRRLDCEFLGWVLRPFFKRGTPVDLFDRLGKRTARARVAGPGVWGKAKRVGLELVRGEAKAGQFGMWAFAGMKLQGSLVHARACDDLIGCTAIVAALRELARRKKSGIGIFTRREETGLCGAFDLAQSKLLPRQWKIISVETSSQRCNALQKDGPIVRVGDRSAIFDPALTAELCGVAARMKVPFRWQRKLMDGGTCEATAFLKHGYRAGGLCIALGNYHNCGANGRIRPENVDTGDLAGLVALMVAIAANNATH